MYQTRKESVAWRWIQTHRQLLIGAVWAAALGAVTAIVMNNMPTAPWESPILNASQLKVEQVATTPEH